MKQVDVKGVGTRWFDLNKSIKLKLSDTTVIHFTEKENIISENYYENPKDTKYRRCYLDEAVILLLNNNISYSEVEDLNISDELKKEIKKFYMEKII